MYVGRAVAIGANMNGQALAGYRVSSRSFGHRQAVQNGSEVVIVPQTGSEDYAIQSPYVSYTCTSLTKRYSVVSNGTHTTIIANKLSDGYSMRDALSQTLISMDFEHDHLNTPRIAGIVEPQSMTGYLGVVTKADVQIKKFTLEAEKAWFVTTYELCEPKSTQTLSSFDAVNADDTCQHLLHGPDGSKFDHPVLAVATVWNDRDWEVGVQHIST